MLLVLALAVSPAARAADPDALAPRDRLPPMSVSALVLPDGTQPATRLTVKLVDDARGRAAEGRLTSAVGADLTAVQLVLDRHGATVRPLLDLDDQGVAGLQARAEARTGHRAADLAGMLRVDGPRSAEDRVTLAEALQALPQVEWAWVAVEGAPPPGDLGSPTDDYSDLQDSQQVGAGIGARALWDEGIRGSAVRISDVEYGWIDGHEDLVDRDLGREPGQVVPDFVAEYGWDHHGTAVLGQLVAIDNGYGVTGGAPDAGLGTYPEWTDADEGRRPAAIAAAAADSLPGDVILLEMQTVARPGGSYGPAELDPDVWTVVRTAVDAGIVVVGAAGNGGEDLDDSWYVENHGVWGDSGAILVGAGTADEDHDRLYFSTYGSRVDLQGWGRSVVTLGYGDLATVDDDPLQTYTDGFSGTSSASPLVAVSAALVQDYAITALGAPLSPDALRALLVATGAPQGTGSHIGPLPDLVAALDALDGDRDGFASLEWGGEDCDDASALATPGGTEVWYDGIDGDCLGGDDFDVDGDGIPGGPGGADCDDQDPDVGAAVTEIPDNGIDDDCDGAIDEPDDTGGDSGGDSGDSGVTDSGRLDGDDLDGGGFKGGPCAVASGATTAGLLPLALALGLATTRRRGRHAKPGRTTSTAGRRCG
ncbi:MAG: S8 family serine peptidase [Alphaproteobacteria bacterium]|nr:S8 family serine peptidase [Alphaproteobacteria bacterium]